MTVLIRHSWVDCFDIITIQFDSRWAAVYLFKFIYIFLYKFWNYIKWGLKKKEEKKDCFKLLEFFIFIDYENTF